jgi:ankyrin repeat protein
MVIVSIAFTMIFQFTIHHYTLKNKLRKENVYKYFYRNQKIYGEREISQIFNIFLFTSWISPCTVWANNKLFKTSFLLKTAFASFVINCFSLSTLYLAEDYAISFFNRNPPITHCFLPDQTSKLNLTRYNMINITYMYQFFTTNPVNEDFLPKLRICSDGEQPQDFLKHYLLPIVFGCFSLGFLSAAALQWFSSYKTLHHSVLNMFKCPKLFQHFFNELLHPMFFQLEMKYNYEEGRSASKKAINIDIEKIKHVIDFVNNRENIKLSAVSCFKTLEENTRLIKDSKSIFNVLKNKFPELNGDILQEAKIWDGLPPIHRAAQSERFILWCFLILLGGEAAAMNGLPESSVHMLSDSDSDSITMWLVRKAIDKFGKDALFNAVKMNDTEKLEILIENGFSLNDTDSNQNTPLHITATNGSIESMLVLIYNGQNINAKNMFKETPLHNASLQEQSECLNVLIENGAEVNAKDNKGETPLHIAAKQGQSECLKVLIENTAEVNAENRFGETPLYHAVVHKISESRRILIENGAKVYTEEMHERDPLHIAALKGNIKCLKYLIEIGADVNAKDNHKQTPLYNAALKGNIKCLKILIEIGADVNAKDNHKQTPLYNAAKEGQFECLKILIENGAKVNARDIERKTPLHFAVLWRGSECSNILIQNGAEVNAQDCYGQIPIHIAAWRGQSECLKVLIENGAEVNAENSCSETPLYYALMQKKSESWKILIENGGKVFNEEIHGKAALHIAALKGKIECLKLLIENGAEVNVKDYEGETPLHNAACRRQSECLKILIENGAEVNAKDNDGQTPLFNAARQ